jgi:hypothetical protein
VANELHQHNNGLTGDLTGDLTLALTTLPGVTLIPSATGGLPTVSAFGITGDQNGMVLNGMGFGGNVPRDGFRVGVVTSSYDPSRGGFAGIQTTLRMQGGTNLLQRSIHTTLDAPALQWTRPSPRSSRRATVNRSSVVRCQDPSCSTTCSTRRPFSFNAAPAD